MSPAVQGKLRHSQARPQRRRPAAPEPSPRLLPCSFVLGPPPRWARVPLSRTGLLRARLCLPAPRPRVPSVASRGQHRSALPLAEGLGARAWHWVASCQVPALGPQDPRPVGPSPSSSSARPEPEGSPERGGPVSGPQLGQTLGEDLGWLDAAPPSVLVRAGPLPGHIPSGEPGHRPRLSHPAQTARSSETQLRATAGTE